MLSPTFLFALLFVLRAFRRFGQQPAESQRMTITKKHGKRLRRIRTDDESFRVDMLCKSLADLLRACLELLRDRQAGSRRRANGAQLLCKHHDAHFQASFERRSYRGKKRCVPHGSACVYQHDHKAIGRKGKCLIS